MRWSSAIRAALIALTVSGAGLTTVYADFGGIRFNVIKAGFVVGGSGGFGTVMFHGRAYPISIGGVLDLPSVPQRPILSVRSATSERRSTLMVYTALRARASQLALLARAGLYWPTRTGQC